MNNDGIPYTFVQFFFMNPKSQKTSNETCLGSVAVAPIPLAAKMYPRNSQFAAVQGLCGYHIHKNSITRGFQKTVGWLKMNFSCHVFRTVKKGNKHYYMKCFLGFPLNSKLCSVCRHSFKQLIN